jgi:predicted MFS family arabinose efflux permease
MPSRSPSAEFAQAPPAFRMWLHIFAGLAASLIGIGLARFAYTPLVPSLIKAKWFAANQVVFLGAANLAGYLVGALVGRPIAARIGNVRTLRAMMILVTVSLFACAFPKSVAWFFAWRALSGIAGGAIMVLVAATVLPFVPVDKRGLASGAVFLGLGFGIAASGTVVPLLLGHGLQATWIGLAAVGALFTLTSWFCWPSASKASPTSQARSSVTPQIVAHERWKTTRIYIVYALLAFAVVPPMVFLVDFIARGWNGGAGEHTGAIFWIVYGVGAIAGPPLYGQLADRIGALTTVRLALAVQLAALLGLALTASSWLLIVVVFVAGTFPPGIVPMALAWIRDTHPGDAGIQNALWSRITSVFAAVQAFAAYAYSAVFAATGGRYELLFELGAGGIVLALAVDFVMSMRASTAHSPAARTP